MGGAEWLAMTMSALLSLRGGSEGDARSPEVAIREVGRRSLLSRLIPGWRLVARHLTFPHPDCFGFRLTKEGMGLRVGRNGVAMTVSALLSLRGGGEGYARSPDVAIREGGGTQHCSFVNGHFRLVSGRWCYLTFPRPDCFAFRRRERDGPMGGAEWPAMTMSALLSLRGGSEGCARSPDVAIREVGAAIAAFPSLVVLGWRLVVRHLTFPRPDCFAFRLRKAGDGPVGGAEWLAMTMSALLSLRGGD